jgi:hypothetical protein
VTESWNNKLRRGASRRHPAASVRKNAEKLPGLSSPLQAQLNRGAGSVQVNQGELKGTMVNARERGHAERDRSCLSVPYCTKPNRIRPQVTFRGKAKPPGGKMCGKARRTRNAE